METALEQVQKKRKETENLLLRKANRRSDEELQRAKEYARIGGRIEKAMTLADCLECLLAFDARFYAAKNPNLQPPERVKEVADLTLEWVDLKSHAAQLDKALNLLREIQKIDSELQNDPSSRTAEATRRTLCMNLESILDSRYHFAKANFDDMTQVAFRVFCGQKGDIPFDIQVELLKRMLEMDETDPDKFKEIVIQLIMGGGKTAVIGTMILYLASMRKTANGKKRLAFFIVPPSLFKTFSINFSEAMWQSFGKEVIALDLSRDDFTLYRLQETEKLLAKAMERQWPIISSAVTPLGMELEGLSLARRIRTHIRTGNTIAVQLEQSAQASKQLIEALRTRKQGVANSKDALGAKATSIARQLTLTAESADSLLDEVDQILDCYIELTYVDGARIPVDAAGNQLLLTIYKALISNQITIETLPSKPTPRDLVRLTTNNQSLLKEATYVEHVIPVAARYVFDKFKPISSQLPNFADAFVRYASGQMPPDLQKLADSDQPISLDQISSYPDLKDYPTALDDIAYLKHLKMLAQGKENQKEAAELIAQTKQFLTELTKTTLGKMGGRNYGQSLIQELQHKIIPLRGVNAPAPRNNEFGNEWVTAACSYQWGAAFLPNRDQILERAANYLTSAHHYVERNGEKLEETAEWKEFKSLYGITLNEIDQPGKIDEAIAAISKDPDKLLEMRYAKVFMDATYASERLTNDGFALLEFSHSTRTMSATPWNLPGYDKRLVRRCFPSVGTEGRILHMAAKRSVGNKIYEIDFSGSRRQKPDDHAALFRGDLSAASPVPPFARLCRLRCPLQSIWQKCGCGQSLDGFHSRKTT